VEERREEEREEREERRGEERSGYPIKREGGEMRSKERRDGGAARKG